MYKVNNSITGNQFDQEEAWRIEQEAIQEERQQQLDKMSNRFDSRFNKQQSTISKYAEARYWVGVLSYIPQIMSIIVAFKGGRVLMEWIPVPYLEWIFAGFMLIALEVIKRRFSDRFWDQWFATKRVNFMAAGINFSALLFSILLSGFGIWFLIGDNSEEAKTMGLSGDPEAVALQDQIRQLESSIAEHRQNKNSAGKIYWPSQKAIQQLEAQKTELTTTLREQHGVIVMKNQGIMEQWMLRMNYQKYTGLGLTLLLEIIFEVMMAFMSWYDYRKWVVMRRMNSKGNSSPPTTRRTAGFNMQPELYNTQPNYTAPPGGIGFFLPMANSQNKTDTEPPAQVVREEPVQPVPQETQPDTEQPAQVVRETVQVRADKLRRDITTYYPRIFPKSVTDKGSARETTRQRNRKKVEAWVEELRQCGIETRVNYDNFEQVKFETCL